MVNLQATVNAASSSSSNRDPLLNSALDSTTHSQPTASLTPASSIAQRLNALDNTRPSLTHQAVPQLVSAYQLQNYLRNSSRSSSPTSAAGRYTQSSHASGGGRQPVQDHVQLLSRNPSPRSQQQLRMQIHCNHDRSQQRQRQQRTVPNDNHTPNQSRQRVVPNDHQNLNQLRGVRPYQLSPRVQRNIARNLSMIIRTRIGQHRSGTENTNNNNDNTINNSSAPEFYGDQPR